MHLSRKYLNIRTRIVDRSNYKIICTEKKKHLVQKIPTMRIGYPCINNSIPRNATSTFRLASYSESRMIQTVKDNLIHLNEILKYNVKNNLLFFRIRSDLVPFASHPICKFEWYKLFQSELLEIGDYIKKNNSRISMHPDQQD
jgi:UV DNA damage endonuclease